MNNIEPTRMDRHEAIQWMVAATVSALNYSSFGAATTPPGIGTDPICWSQLFLGRGH